MLAEMAERRLTCLILVHVNVQLVSGLCYMRKRYSTIPYFMGTPFKQEISLCLLGITDPLFILSA
jgi:hypothetical protein